MRFESTSSDNCCSVFVTFIQKMLSHFKEVAEESAMYEFGNSFEVSRCNIGSEGSYNAHDMPSDVPLIASMSNDCFCLVSIGRRLP